MVLRSRLNSKSQSSHFAAIPFAQCPAKTWEDADGNKRPGRNVFNHCQIVGRVAEALIQRYPENVRRALFRDGDPLVAAAHDIGKVSPTFYEKIRDGAKGFNQNLPKVESLPYALEVPQWGGHAGVSQLTARHLQAPRWIPEILGQHHGFSPDHLLAGHRAEDEQFGAQSWNEQRIALLQALKDDLGLDWPHVEGLARARLLAGLTSVADWIGSGEFFENPDLDWQPRIQQAIEDAGFVPIQVRAGLSFTEIFGFQPRAAQAQLYEAASQPGVYVLEAPMGLGKTEAALYAAYQMLERGQATGIYFALPTQLTSNKIHERFNRFLGQILAPDCRQRSLLLHGKAWLQDTEMGEEGRPGGAWFNQAKRGLLAPFAVGTVDQALMAAMNVKHGFVRAFGLAGKVVILDEVHSYDAYTGTILDALIALLRGLHCTVIVLSATLQQSRRGELIDAAVSSMAYPLITACPLNGQAQEYAVTPPVPVQVAIQHCIETERAVAEALRRAEQGQQVLWIENTVVEAQSRYLDLAARAQEIGAACGLLHSRYIAADREQHEAHWVALYGKEGWAHRGDQGRILVGTQVLEQSLDIDADFLVTRFAPTDMLLQRLGRLWRHAETPRSSHAACEAWLLAPILDAALTAPEQAFGPTAYVYAPYVLCRSLEVWGALHQVTLPAEIRGLIEATYAERTETDIWSRLRHDMLEGKTYGRRKKFGVNALRQFARLGVATAGRTLSDLTAPTRYSETDSLEVLVLRSCALNRDDRTSTLTCLNGDTLMLPWDKKRLSKRQWRELTAQLHRQLVSIRPGDAPDATSRKTLEDCGFKNCFFLGSEWTGDDSLLRVALVDEQGHLQGLHGERAHPSKTLWYREDMGYQVVKNSKDLTE